MTISPPVATATDAPLALMDCLSDPRGTVSPRQRGDPVDAGKPCSWLCTLPSPPSGVASVSVEIAGRPASSRRWVLDKLCSWR